MDEDRLREMREKALKRFPNLSDEPLTISVPDQPAKIIDLAAERARRALRTPSRAGQYVRVTGANGIVKTGKIIGDAGGSTVVVHYDDATRDNEPTMIPVESDHIMRVEFFADRAALDQALT